SKNPGEQSRMRGVDMKPPLSDALKITRLYTPEEKEKRIKRALNRLKKIFAALPEDARSVADGLIQEAAFMRVTLEETRSVIDREGVIERFEQGVQRFYREHPATKVYTALINRYQGVMKQLIDLLPAEDKAKQEADELMEFVKSRAR